MEEGKCVALLLLLMDESVPNGEQRWVMGSGAELTRVHVMGLVSLSRVR